MMDTKIKNFVIQHLRRASYKFPERTKAVQAATVDRGYRKCNGCKKTVHYKETNVDHIVPVVGPEGFTTWDSYIERMFCSQELFQILCKNCHEIKTTFENGIRKQYRQQRKVKDDKQNKRVSTKSSKRGGKRLVSRR